MSVYDLVDSLRTSSLLTAALWVTLANFFMFLAAVAGGDYLVRRFRTHRIGELPEPLVRMELVLAAVCVVLNAAVAVAGIIMWREGLISLRPYGEYSLLTVVLDSVVLFMAMDLLMYLFHRVAHAPLLYPIAHSTHHRYNSPRPLSLFVLHPAEVIGFGGLWLVVLVIYTSSVEGILVYLTLNLAFGAAGHLGVELMPSWWNRLSVVKYISTSTFHAGHHMDRGANFGFYTLIWDRLFGTLASDYDEVFTRASIGTAETAPGAQQSVP